MKITTPTLAAALLLGALSVPASAMPDGDVQLRGSLSASTSGYGISAAEIDALDRGNLAQLKAIVSSGESEGQIRGRARNLIEQAG